MKRILSLFLSALLMMSLFAVSFTARAEQIYNWTVKVNTTRTECYITGYTGNTYIRHVMIPSFLDDMAVIDVAMPMKKFPNLANLVFYDDTIMTVTPNCKGCSDLEKVTILDHNDTSRVVSENKLPESIKNVTYDAFAGTSIRELEMPGVETIGRAYSDGAFEDCDNLGKVTIRKPARIFADSFAKIDCVCDIDYNGPVSEWTCEAVRYSPNLKANCNDGWFGWCGDTWDGTGYPSERSNLYWKLTKDGALTVDSIYGTESLEKQTVKTHRWNAFQVTSLSLNHVYNTGKETFRYVEIPTLELPSTVNTIGDYSFANCGKLSEVHIPKSVKTIGNYAFAYCGNLKDIYYDGTWDEWNSVTKKQGWKSGTPSDVKIHCKSTVNFDANGHGKAPASQTGLVSYTDKVVEPTAPSEHQYEFLGWYKEHDCINKWDFDKDIVTDDMTLYAKWKRVLFDINVTGNEGGNPTADKNEAYENTLIHLNPNTSEGWVFKGWQVESDNANIQSGTFKMPADDVTVKALYEQVKNGINVVSTPGGTAIADKDTAANGETVNLTATPDAGWKFKEWEVVTGGVDITGNENASFVMSNQPNVVIRAVFERITYKLTIHTNGNGVVDTGYDTNEIPTGWDVSLNAYPADGYRLKNISFMTEGVNFRYPYVFSMPGFATDVYAEFEPIPISTVSTNSTGNGTIQADKNSAKSGENVYITVTPDEGNRLKDINVTTGNTELWIDEGGYGFSMPDDDVVVSAVFEEIPPTHQLNGEGVLFFDTGINKITEAEAGSDVTVSIDDTQIPDGYYFTKSYLANDVDINVNVEDTSDGTFVMPAHDVTVTPVFAEREDGELDLTGEEAVVLPEKDLAGLLTASEFAGYDDQRNLNYFDFNKDGTPDVWLDCDNNTVQRAEGAASADKNYTIPVDYLIPPRFKSLKFIFAFDPVVETYEVKTIAEEGGTVSEGALYEKGATATVTATPTEGYEFDGWYENGEKVSSDASYSFEVTKYTQLIAKFSEKTSDPVVETYEVKTIAEEGGTVSKGALYEKGATATVTATPAEGYEFDGWYENGEKVSSDASYSFEVTKHTQLVAKFSEKIVVNRITVSDGKFTYNTGLKKITITVYDRYEKPLSGKTVTVIMNSKKSTFTTNADGKITYSFNTVIKPKTYTVKASCEGVNGSSKVVINKAKPKLSARTKTFKKNSKTKKYTVKLKDNKGKAVKKAKITVKIKGKTYKATTNAKGVASFNIKKLQKKGSYKATIKFAGNGYFTTVSKKVKIKIK